MAAFTQVVEYRFRTAPNTPKFRAAYLYSVCTARAYQGQGVMGSFLPQILSELKEAGYAFAFLVPAEVWLIDYYRRLGFQWMSDQVYQTVPKETCPLLRPIDDACDYLKAVDRLEGKSVSQHRFEQQRFGEWQLLQPPVIGWMAVSLQPGFQIPSETCLLQPLT